MKTQLASYVKGHTPGSQVGLILEPAVESASRPRDRSEEKRKKEEKNKNDAVEVSEEDGVRYER